MNTLKVAAVLIARNEDHYINEWVEYYLKIGCDEIFIYQHKWKWQNPLNDKRIHLFERNDDAPQIPAYLDFYKKYSKNFNWGIFFDCDEFLVYKKYNSLKECLENYNDVPVLAIPEKIFGCEDITKDIINDNYSMLSRFTKTSKTYSTLYKKLLINFPKINELIQKGVLKEFNFHGGPHAIKDVESIDSNRKFSSLNSLFLDDIKKEDEILEKFHYMKTFNEFLELKMRGDAYFGDQYVKDFNKENRLNAYHIKIKGTNEVENTLALDLFNK